MTSTYLKSLDLNRNYAPDLLHLKTKAAKMLSTNTTSSKKQKQCSSAEDDQIAPRSHSEDVINNLSTTLDKLNELRIESKFGKVQDGGHALEQRYLQENSSNNSQRTDKTTGSNQSNEAINNLSGTLKKLKKMRARQEIERSGGRRNERRQAQFQQEFLQRPNTQSVQGDTSNQHTGWGATFETRPHRHSSNFANRNPEFSSTQAGRPVQRPVSFHASGKEASGSPNVRGDGNERPLNVDNSTVSTIEKKQILSTYNRTMKETENIFEDIVQETSNDIEEPETVLGLDEIIGEARLSIEHETMSEDTRRMSIEPPDRNSISSVNCILDLSVSDNKESSPDNTESSKDNNESSQDKNESSQDKNESSFNSSKSTGKRGSRSKSLWKRSSSTGNSSSRAREDSKGKTKSENKSQGVKSDADSATSSLRSSIESLTRKVKKKVKATMCIAMPSSAKVDEVRTERRNVKVSRPMNVNIAQTPEEARSKARSYFDMAKHFANELGDFENGCYMFEKAMDERKRFSIANTDSYANLLLEYMKLLKKMGSYAKAEEIWSQSMEIKRMINTI